MLPLQPRSILSKKTAGGFPYKTLINKFMTRYIVFLLLGLLVHLELNGQADYTKTPERANQGYEQGLEAYMQSEYKEAATSFKRAQSQYSNAEAKALMAIMETLSLVEAGQKEKAYFAIEETEENYEKKQVRDPGVAIALNFCLGKYHWEYNERFLAKPLLAKTEKLYKDYQGDAIPLPLEIDLAELLGEYQYSKGSYTEALPYYERTVKLQESLPKKYIDKDRLADDKMRVGEIHDLLLDPDEAVKKYENLLDQEEELLKDDNYRISELNTRIGQSYFKRKQYEVAIPYLRKALEIISKEQSNLDRKADIEFMLATIYNDRRLYELGIEYNSRALEYWKSEKVEDYGRYYQAFLLQGDLFRKIETSIQGRKWYQSIVDKANWEAKIKSYKVEAVKHLALPDKTTDYNYALLSYLKAEDLMPKFSKAEQVLKAIELNMAKGALFLEANDYSRAKIHYQRALDLMKPIYEEKHPLVAEASRAMSEIFLAEQLFSEALTFVDKALNASLEAGGEVSGTDAPDVDKAKFPYELLNALGTKGVILHEMSLGNQTESSLVKSLETFDAAQQLLFKLRKTYRNEGAKYRLKKLAHKISHQAVVSSYLLYELTQKEKYLRKAFEYAEIAKAASLLEAVRDLKARKVSGIPDSLILQENELKVDIAYLQGEVFYELRKGSDKNLSRLSELDLKINRAMKAHSEMLSLFEKVYPKYFNLKYDFATTQLDKLQQTLKDEEMLIEYVLFDSAVFILTINQKQIGGSYVEAKLDLRKLIKDLYNAIVKRDEEAYLKHASTLYRYIIAPIKDQFGENKLIVIPDGELNFIPLGIMPLNGRDQPKSYAEVDYLINQHAVLYNYSAALFVANQQKGTYNKDLQQIAALAPDFSQMNKKILSEKVGTLLQPLPGAISEVQTIGQLFKMPKILLAKDANEHQLKVLADKYAVLHIATHGILDHKNPLYSKLVLKDEEEEDGILHIYEIYNLDLSGELVVLSACNTGIGQIMEGEGILSMARAFSYSGVPNVVMTRWEVSDAATKIIMELFYTNLKAGDPKHIALQKAKKTFLKQNEGTILAPFFWGAIVSAGNSEAVYSLIEEPQTSFFWYYVIGGVFIFLIILLFIFRRKNKA